MLTLWRTKRKLHTNRSVPPPPTREEPAEIIQDVGTRPRPCRDPAHHNPTQEGRRRPFNGQVGALLRRLFLCGRKEKERVAGDPEEINVIPTETTNHEDDVPAPERETQTTSSSDGIRVLAEESEFTPSVETVASPTDGMHVGIPSETVSIPERGIETTTTMDNVSDSEDTIQTTKVIDILETIPTTAEEIESTIKETVAGLEVSIPESRMKTTTTTDNDSDQKGEIQSANVIDIVETVPSPADGTESTTDSDLSSDSTFVSADDLQLTGVVETVAEPKDRIETSTFTETVSIPESGIEITTTADNESDLEDTIQTNDATNNEKVVSIQTDGILLPILKFVSDLKDELEIIIPPKTAPVGGHPKYSWTICLRSKTETADRSDKTTTVPEGSGASEEDINSTTSDERESTSSLDSFYYSAEEEFTPSVDSMDAFIDGLEISIPTETEAIPESWIEIADTPENVSDSEDTIQTNHATDLEERLVTILGSLGLQKDEVEIIIPPKIAPVGGRPKYSYTIVLASKTETTGRSEEAMPTAADGVECTIGETAAGLEDWKNISIPTETASIPKSLIGIYEPDAEMKTEVTNRTDNAPGSAGLPLTTQEQPTEDNPRPGGESGQPAQKTSTRTGRCWSYCRKIGALFCKKKREEEEDTGKGITKIQSDDPKTLTVKSFKYHKVLGKGTFGTVYLASHPDVEELLAVKKARRSFVPLYTFMVERRAQEMMGCSGICPQLYATFHSKDYFFYVMEYVDGETLGHFLPMRYPLDNDIIRYVAAELLCGIQFLHFRGITHNDLHISNILINSTGHVQIIDFGKAITTHPFCPETADALPDEFLKTIWNEYRNDYFDYYCILRFMSENSEADPHSAFYYHLYDLIEKWKTMYGKMRQHQLFEGIDWKELEAGKGRPPYIMEPKPAINPSKTIKVRASKRRLMECRKSHTSPHFPEFDFVSDRWRTMLRTSHQLRPSAPPGLQSSAQPGPCDRLQHSQSPATGSSTARPLRPAPAQPGPCDRLQHSQAPAQ